MGQKVNPHGLRIEIMKDWESKWNHEEGTNDLVLDNNTEEEEGD